MLPFSKRPGHEGTDDAGLDVVTKDKTERPKAASLAAKSRPVMPSLTDEEMTTMMPAKSLGILSTPRASLSSPPPRASRASVAAPPSRASVVPPPSRSSVAPPPVRSSRVAAFDDLDDDDDDDGGRTVVRGGPAKVVKRARPSITSSAGNKNAMSAMPTAVQPAAVIKSTLESARAMPAPSSSPAKKAEHHLLAPPPADLLEDLADFGRKPASQEVGEHTVVLPQGVPAPQPSQPQLASSNSQPIVRAVPQPGRSYQQLPSMGQGSYVGGLPQAPHSVPGAVPSRPAHFMAAQGPYSEGRIDPPATSVTSRTSRAPGRSAMSWAAALLAFGLLVGVGAVALVQSGDNASETGAAFVDPSRTPGTPMGLAAANHAPPPPSVLPAAPVASENVAAVPPVAVPVVMPVTDAPVAAANPAPAVSAAANPAPTAPQPVAAATPTQTPASKPAAVTAPAPKPPVVATPAPQPKPVAVPTPKPTKPAEDVAISKPVKPAKPSKGGSDVDEETKKALEALQKSQLESSF